MTASPILRSCAGETARPATRRRGRAAAVRGALSAAGAMRRRASTPASAPRDRRARPAPSAERRRRRRRQRRARAREGGECFTAMRRGWRAGLRDRGAVAGERRPRSHDAKMPPRRASSGEVSRVARIAHGRDHPRRNRRPAARRAGARSPADRILPISTRPGQAHMVDVGGKDVTRRVARAGGPHRRCAPATLALIRAGSREQGRRAGRRAHRGDPGGQADRRPDSALPSAAAHARRRRVRARRGRRRASRSRSPPRRSAAPASKWRR